MLSELARVENIFTFFADFRPTAVTLDFVVKTRSP